MCSSWKPNLTVNDGVDLVICNHAHVSNCPEAVRESELDVDRHISRQHSRRLAKVADPDVNTINRTGWGDNEFVLRESSTAEKIEFRPHEVNRPFSANWNQTFFGKLLVSRAQFEEIGTDLDLRNGRQRLGLRVAAATPF